MDTYNQIKENLLKLGLVKVVNGRSVPNSDRVETSFEIPSENIRMAHKFSLQRMINNIDKVDVTRRDLSKYTISTNPKKIVLAKKKIQTFARKLSEFLESDSKTEVYELSIQLFPWKISQ